MTTAPPTVAPPSAGPAFDARPTPDSRPAAPAVTGRPAPSRPSAGSYLVRTVLVVILVLAAALSVHLVLISSLQQRSEQRQLLDRFRSQLAQGTAPVGPTDSNGAVLPVGAPVAYLEIPEIGVKQVVVSGTASGTLFAGPGHRRDSVLPGQVGSSVFMGRSAAYGGPFADIDSLDKGDTIKVTTGQGQFTFRVLGVRRAGDAIPATPKNDESRLVLTSVDGIPFFPDDVVRVDATMNGKAEVGPGRLFPLGALPAVEETMAGDTSELWALVFFLQALILVAVGAVWAWHRWGHPQAWIAFVPPLLLVGMAVANQAARVLPNLL